MADKENNILSNLSSNGEYAMEQMYAEYYSQLAFKAIRYVKSKEIAEDLVQELFVDIWNKRHNFNIKSSLSGYLNRSIVNRSLNWLRANKYHIEDIENQTSLVQTGNKVDLQLESNDLETFLTKRIDKLPEKCRLVFVMSRFDEMSYKEIAEKLDISLKTVENQISKALKVLRKSMKDFETL